MSDPIRRVPPKMTQVARARRPLDRAYAAFSVLLVLALGAVLFVTVIQASPSTSQYAIGWSLDNGQAGSAFQVVSNNSFRTAGGPDEIGFERRLYGLINKTRVEHQLPPLKLNETLTRAARGHSRDMADSERFDSVDASGRTSRQRAQDAGFTQPQLVLESIGAGFSTPDELMSSLLANPNGARNLMNGEVNEVGVGYAYSRAERSPHHYWTIDLGRKGPLSFALVVDNGSESTTSSEVTLYIGGKGWAKEMELANDPDFAGATWETFAETRRWTLSEGTGPKDIYVKLRSPDGQELVLVGQIALMAAAKGIKPGAQPIDARAAPRAPVVRSPAGEIALSGAPYPGAPAGAEYVAAATALAPGYYQTSEFMLGTVAVGIVMPQCNGTIDKCTEAWTPAAMDQVAEQVRLGTNWWVRQMNGRVSFVFDQQRQAATGYEPINHPQSDEGLWIGDVMTHLGFPGTTYFEQVYAYNNWLRQKYGTDWAYTIFVANSINNVGGTFSNGFFAYSYVPGPFTIETYDNDGYTIKNMASVVAHETGHVFGALDQYSGAKIPCTSTSGYLILQNQNSQQNCKSNVDSIMRGGLAPYNGNLIDSFALGMVGGRFSGNTSLPDPINTVPTILLNPMPAMVDNLNPTIKGTAQDQPYVPPSGNAISINNIAAVKYRVDGGAWQDARPSDGSPTFNKVSQSFSFAPSLNPGPHLVEVQAINRVNHAAMVSETVTVRGPAVLAATTPVVPAKAPVASDPSAAPSGRRPAPPAVSPTPATGLAGSRVHLTIRAGRTALSLPVSNYTASSLLASINAQGGKATEVDEWTGRSWHSYGPAKGGADFAIRAGVGYMVRAEAASEWTALQSGAGTTKGVHLERGWSLVGAPGCKSGAASCYTASTLAAAINSQGGNVSELYRWDNEGWSAYRVGYPFGDFLIAVGEAYMVRSNKQSDWTLQ